MPVDHGFTSTDGGCLIPTSSRDTHAGSTRECHRGTPHCPHSDSTGTIGLLHRSDVGRMPDMRDGPGMTVNMGDGPDLRNGPDWRNVFAGRPGLSQGEAFAHSTDGGPGLTQLYSLCGTRNTAWAGLMSVLNRQTGPPRT